MATGARYIETLPKDTITTIDALIFIGPMTKIMQSTDSYTKALLEKKKNFDTLNLTTKVLSSLHESRVAAQALAKAIQSQMPGTMSWSVMPTVDVIIAALDKTAITFGANPNAYSLSPQPPPPFDESRV